MTFLGLLEPMHSVQLYTTINLLFSLLIVRSVPGANVTCFFLILGVSRILKVLSLLYCTFTVCNLCMCLFKLLESKKIFPQCAQDGFFLV